jgi:hypothetical protein
VVTMSSGSFDGMPHRVLAALRAPRPVSEGAGGADPQPVLQDPLAAEPRAL